MFRARASGWRGSPLAGKQLKEAVGSSRSSPSRIPSFQVGKSSSLAGFTTSLLVSDKIALEILSGRDLLYGCRKMDAVITMPRFRALSARPNAMISAAQCRSARALLGWSVAKLASAALVGASVIDDFEAERRAPVPAVVGPIRRALEPVGVVFLPGEDVGLRPRALFEVGGDIARANVRQTRRSLAADRRFVIALPKKAAAV
jgi:hypothetical protein